MKYLFLVVQLFLLLTYLPGQDHLNVDLLDQFNRGDIRYSGCWSYFDSSGTEYALLGAHSGTAIYRLSNPITEVGFIPGPNTNWREITTLGDKAYVVTDVQDENHGMQVIDLSTLPDSVHLTTTYTTTFDKGHIIQRDIYSNAPYVYIMGTTTTQGVHILDVSEPENPIEIGLYSPGYYIHDSHIKGDLLFACAFYEGVIDIVDISIKSNPVLISQIEDIGSKTHSCWTTEDDNYLIVCDELDGLPAVVYNIEDFENITPVATYSGNLQSLVHNVYIKGQFAYFSHNTEGLRVVDIADPEVPIEVGYFDTFANESGGFNGLWSACPFFPSGRVIGGNREDGLYLWNFNGSTAGRFYGFVKDSVTNLPIFDASIVVVEKADTLHSNLIGEFQSGGLPGIYTIIVFAEGYKSNATTIQLSEGDSLSFSICLAPITSTSKEISPTVPVLQNYPNPFNQFTYFDFKEFTGASFLSFYDPTGRKIFEVDISGDFFYQLSNQHFSSGFYFYELKDATGKVLGKGKMVVE